MRRSRPRSNAVKAVTPKVPFAQVPLAAKLPKPENVVTSAYDFAEKLLSSQRHFAGRAGEGDGTTDGGQRNP